MPEALIRLLAGQQTPSSASDSRSKGKSKSKGVKWVRRRRWARILRRRPDIQDWGFADVAGLRGPEYAEDGPLSELALPPAAIGENYLERAKYFAGSHLGKQPARSAAIDKPPVQSAQQTEFSEKDSALGMPLAGSSAASSMSFRSSSSVGDDASIRSMRTVIGGLAPISSAVGQTLDRAAARRVVARLERAIAELQEGMQTDSNEGRKTEAWDLKQVFERRLDDLREEWPALQESDDAGEENEEGQSRRFSRWYRKGGQGRRANVLHGPGRLIPISRSRLFLG